MPRATVEMLLQQTYSAKPHGPPSPHLGPTATGAARTPSQLLEMLLRRTHRTKPHTDPLTWTYPHSGAARTPSCVRSCFKVVFQNSRTLSEEPLAQSFAYIMARPPPPSYCGRVSASCWLRLVPRPCAARHARRPQLRHWFAVSSPASSSRDCYLEGSMGHGTCPGLAASRWSHFG